MNKSTQLSVIAVSIRPFPFQINLLSAFFVRHSSKCKAAYAEICRHVD